MKKWLVLIAGVVLQLIIGGIYAWSIFTKALGKEYNFTDGQSAFIFGFIITVFTLSMILAGKILKKFGPAVIAGTGAVLFGSGYILASFAGGNFVFILLSLGILTGSGIGFIYICPLTVGMQWFPKQKGLVTGVSVAGFGGGAVLLSSFASWLLAQPDIQIAETFRIVGIVFGLTALAGSFFLSFPGGTDKKETTDRESLRPHILTLDFVLLTLGIFSGTFAGLLIIANLKPIILDAGVSEFMATLAISLFAAGNAVGRIFWGRFFDKFGMRTTILLSMASLGVSLLALAAPLPSAVLLGVVFLVGTGFGSCFSVYALSVESRFGITVFSRLYPIVFLGYGLAAITGPAIGGSMSDVLKSFTPSILTAAGIVFVMLAVLALLLRTRKGGNLS